ncbi:MAG: hypothetical protein GKR90_25645 [Pseudomonadales bacterium]|nr:hypothetical protein [Pseudomonadales bacterium]
MQYFHDIRVSQDAPDSSKHANLRKLDSIAQSSGFSVPQTLILDTRKLSCYRSFINEATTAKGPYGYRVGEGDRIGIRMELEDVFIGESSFCVRSLSDAEGDNGSFAGVYHSEVNVPRHLLCQAIDEVLSHSVSSTVAHSLHRGGASKFPGMAVGLQPYLGGPGWIGGVVQAPFAPLFPRPASLISVGRSAVGITAGTRVSEDHLVVASGDGFMTLERTPGEETEEQFLLTQAGIKLLLTTTNKLIDEFRSSIEIEWAMSPSLDLYILQVRTVSLGPSTTVFGGAVQHEPLCSGFAVGNGRVVGRAFVTKTYPTVTLDESDILVAPAVSEGWFEHVEKAGGLITQIGSRNAHIASVAAEAGTLCAVGCDSGIHSIAHGDLITLACISREISRVPLWYWVILIGFEVRLKQCP